MWLSDCSWISGVVKMLSWGVYLLFFHLWLFLRVVETKVITNQLGEVEVISGIPKEKTQESCNKSSENRNSRCDSKNRQIVDGCTIGCNSIIEFVWSDSLSFVSCKNDGSNCETSDEGIYKNCSNKSKLIISMFAIYSWVNHSQPQSTYESCKRAYCHASSDVVDVGCYWCDHWNSSQHANNWLSYSYFKLPEKSWKAVCHDYACG